MKSEGKIYREKLVKFIRRLQHAFFQSIEMDEDLNPTFDLASLPFQVKYCYSLLFCTDNGALRLTAVQTEEGMDVLWLEENQSEKRATSVKPINERCKNVSWKGGYNNLPFKFKIEFESTSITIYAAEIYDNDDGSVRFVINDEMLLVFESEVEAEKFDAQIDYA
jgi:hypothetical protein